MQPVKIAGGTDIPVLYPVQPDSAKRLERDISEHGLFGLVLQNETFLEFGRFGFFNINPCPN